MSVKITRSTDRLQLAGLISQAFQDEGMSAVLVGGAVVSIYTHNKYQSYDLDFISPDDGKKITEVMKSLGFKKVGKNFEHPKTELFVEFPPGPLAIGNRVPVKPDGQIKIGKIKIVLLSPTQCVMDRLAAWYHWNDTQSLEQAIMVAHSQPIKLNEIKKWSEAEGEPEKFSRFAKRLAKN